MNKYANLVTSPIVRDNIFGQVTAEYHRTCEIMERMFGGELAAQRPHLASTLALRTPALAMLHSQQIRLFRTSREKRHSEAGETEPVLTRLLLTINAIAGGLRTTG